MSKPKKTWLFIALAASLLLALTLASTARAVEFTNDGVISAGQVVDDDIFIYADHVQVDGTVNGDLFVNSRETNIKGTVKNNLLAANNYLSVDGVVEGDLVFWGQSAIINGRINGTIYAFGSDIKLGSQAVVGRNIFFMGYSLDATPGSTIGRDVLANVAEASLRGAVGRDVTLDATALEIAGKIGGDVTAKVGAPEDITMPAFWLINSGVTIPQLSAGLRVFEEAQIGGKLTYTSKAEQRPAIRAVPAGGIEYRPTKDTSPDAPGGPPSPGAPGVPPARPPVVAAQTWGLNLLRDLVTLLILGGVIVSWQPAMLKRVAGLVQSCPLPSFGWGFVALVGGFVATGVATALVLMLGILAGVVSLSGLSFILLGLGSSGIALTFFLFITMIVYGSKLVVAYQLGHWLVGRFARHAIEQGLLVIAVGVVVYALLSSIPFLGVLIAFVTTLLGLGAICLAVGKSNEGASIKSP